MTPETPTATNFTSVTIITTVKKAIIALTTATTITLTTAVTARRNDLLDGLLVAAFVDVPGDDDGAEFGELLRKKSADARTASGDLKRHKNVTNVTRS